MRKQSWTGAVFALAMLAGCGKEALIKENEALKAQLAEKEKQLFQTQFSLDKCNKDTEYLKNEITKIQHLPKNERSMRDVDLK